MRRLKPALRFIDNLNDSVGKFISFFVLILVAILCWEIFVRSVFNAPTMWAHESTQYFFAAHFMMGGAYALRHQAMVNVTILHSRFSPKVRAIIDIFTSAVFFLFIGVLLWKGTHLAIKSVARGEMSQTPWGPPIYPLKIILVIGALLVLFQGLVKLVRDISVAKTGQEPE